MYKCECGKEFTREELREILERNKSEFLKEDFKNMILKGGGINASESDVECVFGYPSERDYNGRDNDFWFTYDGFTVSGCGSTGTVSEITLDQMDYEIHELLNKDIWDADEKYILETIRIYDIESHEDYVEWVNYLVRSL